MTTKGYPNWLSASSNKSFGLLGYMPYQASIGAKLHQASVFDLDGVSMPTVGSIVYIPTTFCDSFANQSYFRFADMDGDPCLNADHELHWYKIRPKTGDFASVTSWDELEVTEINNDTHPGHILDSGFIPESQFTTGLLIPKDAIGHRIGFVYQPKSAFGLPTEGVPIRVWDVGYFFGQNAPTEAGIVEFDYTSHKINRIDTPSANAGGIVIDAPSQPTLSNVTFSGHFLIGTKIGIQYTFKPHQSSLKNTNYKDISRFWWGSKGETLAIAKQEALNGPVDAYSPVLTQENIGTINEVTVLPVSHNIEQGYVVAGDFQTFEIKVPQKVGEFTIKAADPNLTALANGRESLPFIVTLKDTRGFAMANQKIDFQSTYPAGLSERTAYTDNNGIAKLSASSKYSLLELYAIEPAGQFAYGQFNFIGAHSLEVILADEKAKAGESIDMTITVKDENGKGMPYMPVRIQSIAASNRQNMQTFTKYLRFNGIDNNPTELITNEQGGLDVSITEILTLGRKTEFEVRSHSVVTKKSVIFTTISSPDVETANNWGHMSDTVTVDELTFARPKLFAERPVEITQSVEFENWGLYTHQQALSLCGENFPSIEQLERLYQRYPNGQLTELHGWPTSLNSTAIYNSQNYRSRTKSPISNTHEALDLSAGQRAGELDTSNLFVTCLQPE